LFGYDLSLTLVVPAPTVDRLVQALHHALIESVVTSPTR